MAKAQLVIELSPTRLEVAVIRRGRVAEARALRHHTPQWAEQWPAVLSSLDAPLRELVQALGVSGASAVILCSTPTAASNFHACPATIGRAQALDAARLSLTAVASYSIDDNPASVLACAAPGSRVDHAQHQTFAASESDDTAQALFGWARRAGLKPRSLVPIEGVSLHAAVRAACEPSASPAACRAVLWLGEHSSALAVGGPDGLSFARSLSLGIDALAAAMTRPIQRKSGATDDLITLTIDDARAILQTHGIPKPTDLIDPARALDGAAILPMLQPVIQRLSIEIKQSIRYGLTDDQRGSLEFRLVGPGSTIRCAAEIFERHALQREPKPSTAHDDAPQANISSSSINGPIAAWLMGCGSSLDLSPIAHRERLAESRISRRLTAGLAIAALAVAVEGTFVWMDLRLHERIDHPYSLARIQTLQTIHAATTASQALEAQISRSLAPHPRIAPVLETLASTRPPPLQLTNLRFGPDENAMLSLSLEGVALLPDQSDAAKEFKRWIDRLEAVPVFHSVSLSSTHRQSQGDSESQHFELAAKVLPVPHDVQSPPPLAQGDAP